MKKYLVFLMILYTAFSYGQRINFPSPDDIQGIQVTRFDSFAGQDLYKYLGTRADLCFEYGFRQMYICDYSLQDDKVRMELYIMEDALSAFGIYSLSITTCNFWNLYSTFSCKNNDKFSAAFGPFFINVINTSKTNSGQGLCDQIIKMIITRNPQETWYLPPLFQAPMLSRYINTLKYTEGPKGASSGTPMFANFFENLRVSCYSITIKTPTYTGILARIVFPDPSSLRSFVIQAGLNNATSTTPTMSVSGTYRSSYGVDDYKLIYLECSSPDLKLSDLIPDKPDSMW